MIDKLLIEKLKKMRANGARIGLCHGCFDILHCGHIVHFEEASRHVDYLVVSITADRYVSKGKNRPIYTAEERRRVVSAIRYVNEVVISHASTAVEVLKMVPFDIYFKGPDYVSSDDERLRAEVAVANSKGKIQFTSGHKYSSSLVIEIIRTWGEEGS